jgi:predicted GNAT family acetyltransferase
MSFDPLFRNPVWSTLNDTLAGFATGSARAKRFDPSILPFVAVSDASDASAEHLDYITSTGDDVYVVGVIPKIAAQWRIKYEGEIAQMIFDGSIEKPHSTFASRRLSLGEVGDMLKLTGIAYPGFFRARTHEVGDFWGIYKEGELVSMLGTRMRFDRFCEITTICTDPRHTGRGYSSHLVAEMVVRIHSQSQVAFLHVDCANTRAMNLYKRCGFSEFNRVRMVHIGR